MHGVGTFVLLPHEISHTYFRWFIVYRNETESDVTFLQPSKITFKFFIFSNVYCYTPFLDRTLRGVIVLQTWEFWTSTTLLLLCRYKNILNTILRVGGSLRCNIFYIVFREIYSHARSHSMFILLPNKMETIYFQLVSTSNI
jgi:hypothetical protein